MRGRTRRAGFTLVEIAISAVVLSMLFGGIALATVSSSGAVSEGLSQAEVDKLTGRVLARMIDEFESAIQTSLTPTAALTAGGSPTIDYSQDLGWDDLNDQLAGAGEVVRIEFDDAPNDPANGLDDDGDGLIDQGHVYLVRNPDDPVDEQRITLAKGVARMLEGEVADGVNDENGNGLVDEQGLWFTLDGNELTIRLTLERVGANGRRYVSTAESSVFLRN